MHRFRAISTHVWANIIDEQSYLLGNHVQTSKLIMFSIAHRTLHSLHVILEEGGLAVPLKQPLTNLRRSTATDLE